MVSMTELWLPILLSAVFVFVASSIFHMVLPIHKGDYRKLLGEEKLMEEMRAQNVQPGAYMFPCADSMKEMASPEMMEKYKRGPVGFLTVVPSGAPSMGKNLILWFVYSIAIGLCVAYTCVIGLSRGEAYTTVFRIAATVATLGYAVTHIPDSIWKGQSWGTTLKFIVDGVIYGLLTAGTFGWLWPDNA